MPCTIVPHLMGGLGNWLFQVAAAVRFAEDTSVNYCLAKNNASRSPHSRIDYFSTILSKFNQKDGLRTDGLLGIGEPGNFRHNDYRAIINQNKNQDIDIQLVGYFQNHEFIPQMFKEMLSLPYVDSSTVKDTCFIHIRGGDYVNHHFHDVKLTDYYIKSIAHMKSLGITKFSVFTNDKPYALQQGFLKDIDYKFVDAPELESLALMAECDIGAICANSTFSWWGAYLNRARPICMPPRWFNDPGMNIVGYYFSGVTVPT